MNWKTASFVLAALFATTVCALVYLGTNLVGDGLQGPAATVGNPPLAPAASSNPAPTPTEVAVDPPPTATTSPDSVTPTSVEAWNEQIGVVLTDPEMPMRQRSQQLLAMVARDDATIDQRLDALHHGLNLLADEDYWDDALALGLRSDLPKEISETMFNDLHGRDTKLLLATCDEIVKVEGHPFLEEAKGVMEFLGEPEESIANN